MAAETGQTVASILLACLANVYYTNIAFCLKRNSIISDDPMILSLGEEHFMLSHVPESCLYPLWPQDLVFHIVNHSHNYCVYSLRKTWEIGVIAPTSSVVKGAADAAVLRQPEVVHTV